MVDLNTITKELRLGCQRLGVAVSETFAALVASTIVRPEGDAFYVERNLEDTEARAVVDGALRQLLGPTKSPQLETLKLQASYEAAVLEMEQRLEVERKVRADLEEQVLEQIVGSPSLSLVEDFDGMTLLYEWIFKMIQIRSDGSGGVSSPSTSGRTGGPHAENQAAIEREIAAALESVFPRVGVRSFVALSRSEKTAQLEELCSIVLGIRLFNKHLGNGGIGLPSIEQDEILTMPVAKVPRPEKPDLATNSDRTGIEQTMQALGIEIRLTQDACEAYQKHLTTLSLADVGNSAEHVQAREELYCRRQQLVYLTSLQDEMAGMLERRASDLQAYRKEMKELDALVGARTSVPKEQIYPKFDSLAQIYLVASQEARLLQERQQLFAVLARHKAAYNPRLRIGKTVRMAVSKADEGDDDKSGSESRPVTAPEADAPRRLNMEDTPDFMSLPLDFQGFCIASLITFAILVPGKPELGVVKYMGRYCVFASEATMNQFMASPQSHFFGVRQTCYRSPSLIHLLRLQEDFPKSSLVSILRGREGHRVEISPSGDVAAPSSPSHRHLVELKIETNYASNDRLLSRGDSPQGSIASDSLLNSKARKLPKLRGKDSEIAVPNAPPKERTPKVLNIKFRL